MTYQGPSRLALIRIMLAKSMAGSFKTVALILRHPYVSAPTRRKAEDVEAAWVVKMHPFAQAVRAQNPDKLDMNLHMMLAHNKVPGYNGDMVEECEEAIDAAENMRELRSDMLSEHRYLAMLIVIPLSWIASIQSRAKSNRMIKMYANTQLPDE